jgi:hypothetical protein
MGLFDGPAAVLYRRDDAGQAVFCPWGKWGRCYAVPPEREAELPRFLRRVYMSLFVLIVPAGIWLGWWILLLAPLCTVVIYLKYWAFARTLVPLDSAPPQASRRALFQAHARATGRGFIWASLVASLFFVASSIWMYWKGDRSTTTYVVLGFFTVTAIVNLLQLRQVR